MAKILFLSFPEHGHINPTIALVKELVARDHQVIYYAGASFRDLITFTGAEFRDYDVTLPELVLGGNLVEATNIMFRRSELLYEAVESVVPALAPDLIIHDGVCGWAKCLAAQHGIPAISSISCFAMNETLLKSLNNLKDAVKFFYSLFFSKLGKEFQGLIGNHNQRLAKAGLPVPPKGRMDLVDFSTAPEKLNIVYATKTWQPMGDQFGDDYLFIGPTMTARKQNESFEFPAERPRIYLSMGTILNRDVDLYRTCFDAVRGLDANVILSAGRGAAMLKEADIPENVFVYESVPQLTVLQHVDLFMSQGGMNSVNEAMFYGVPMILFPVTGEQTLNARTVVNAGAGLMPKSMKADTLRDAIQQILDDQSYKAAAEAVARDFKQGPGVTVAAEAIEAYVAAAQEALTMA